MPSPPWSRATRTKSGQIRALFDESYPVERKADSGGDHVRIKARRFNLVRAIRSGRAWLAVLASIAVLTAAFVAVRVLLDPALPIVPAPPLVRALPIGISNVLERAISRSVIESPAQPGVPLPNPPTRMNWRGLAWLAGPTLVVAFLGFWSARLRAGARRWTAEAWGSTLAALPGPFHAMFVMKNLVTRLPEPKYEDPATVLGRAFSRESPSQQIDVPEACDGLECDPGRCLHSGATRFPGHAGSSGCVAEHGVAPGGSTASARTFSGRGSHSTGGSSMAMSVCHRAGASACRCRSRHCFAPEKTARS